MPATRPGQFIQLGCRAPDDSARDDGGEIELRPGALHQPELCGRLALLRRPFSLAGRGDTPRGTWVEVIHRVVGVGTDWLSRLKPGDPVDLIGPLGNAFTLPEGKSVGLLVGGGVGLPPMFYLAHALHQAGWTGVGFVGAMTRNLLAVTLDAAGDAHQFKQLHFKSVITTDDGSFGLKGRITDGLLQYLNGPDAADAAKAVIYTCGPEPMMHAVAKIAAERGIDCQVCLEQAMACGMGTCQSCIVKIESAQRPHGTTADNRPWRYKLACTDGPVFESSQVIW